MSICVFLWYLESISIILTLITMKHKFILTWALSIFYTSYIHVQFNGKNVNVKPTCNSQVSPLSLFYTLFHDQLILMERKFINEIPSYYPGERNLHLSKEY
jgi:hypothetical protein